MARNEPERRRPRRGSGFRVPGGYLDDRERGPLVREALKRVKDKEVRREVEEFLASGGEGELSPKAKNILLGIVESLLMMRRKR